MSLDAAMSRIGEIRALQATLVPAPRRRHRRPTGRAAVLAGARAGADRQPLPRASPPRRSSFCPRSSRPPTSTASIRR